MILLLLLLLILIIIKKNNDNDDTNNDHNNNHTHNYDNDDDDNQHTNNKTSSKTHDASSSNSSNSSTTGGGCTRRPRGRATSRPAQSAACGRPRRLPQMSSLQNVIYCTWSSCTSFPIHPVSVTRFPSFRTQTLENLSRYQ